jgi:hypothetical protein
MEERMRHAVVAALIVALSLACAGRAICLATSVRQQPPRAASTVAQTPVTAEVISESLDRVVLRFTTDPASLQGEREVRGYSALVQVADSGRIEATVLSMDIVDGGGWTDPPLGAGFSVPLAEHAPIGLGTHVAVSAPAVMRDLRVVRVSFHPEGLTGTSQARTNPAVAIDQAIVRSLTLELRSTPGVGVNEKTSPARIRSPFFDRIYRNTVLNYDPDRLSVDATLIGRDRPLEGSRYLIMVDDSMADLADSLVAWKALKGYRPRIVTPSGGSWTSAEIREYIREAYFDWDIPPEFVLLLGDTELVPTGGGEPKTDNIYAALEAGDYLQDVFVGRIPADDEDECRLMLAKTMAYERPWLHDDSEWPMSASLIVRQDDDPSDAVYYGNTWFAYDLMSEAGFTSIDTLFTRNGSTASDVYASLAEGKGFLTYRGVSGAFWIEPFQVLPWLTQPRWELPIVISATCLSGDYYGDESVCEYFLEAGDEFDPRGATAFFGTSTAGAGFDLSMKRGHVYEGFFDGAFGPGRALAEACAAARLNMHIHFGDRDEYEGWNLLGDPDLSLWTARSATAEVDHAEYVSVSSESLVISVVSAGSPITGASVVADGMPFFFGIGETDATGRAAIPLALAVPGTLSVSVTAKNLRPANSRVVVLSSGPFAVIEATEVSDSEGGNGDGYASPGEGLAVAVALQNLGDATAPDVSALLRSSDAHVTMQDSLAYFGDIAQGLLAWGEDPYTLEIDESWPGGYALPLELVVAYGDSHYVLPLPPLETVTGDVLVKDLHLIDDPPSGNGNGLLEPGEVLAIRAVLQNESGAELTSLGGVLTSRNPHVAVTSPTSSLPDVPPGGQSDNADLPFVISLSPEAEPGDAGLALRVAAQAPSYAYAETLALSVGISEVAHLLPTGPDAYGYYAYDSTDTLYSAAPRFEWTELAPPGPGELIESLSAADDHAETFGAELPIQYYSTLRSDVSICTNGFIMLKRSEASQPDNMPIPTPGAPAALVAPLWDDLDPSSGGDIYKWYDEERHRFIVEYDRVRHADSELTETFQIIIQDRSYYPTPTHDSPLLFLYKEVSDPGGCTAGIEHPYGTTGVEYVHNGEYGGYAAALSDSLAILFTTTPPETLEFPWLVLEGSRVDDTEGGDGDSLLTPGESADLIVELRNRGSDEAIGVTLSLRCDSPGVSILSGSSALPDVPPMGSASNEGTPFVIAVEETLRASVATLWIDFGDEANTRQGALRFDLPFEGASNQPEPKLQLAPCRPNPFLEGTRIAFNLPGAGRSTVRVYDVAGRLVRNVDDSVREAGSQEVTWDGRNESGRLVASGVYFVRLSHGDDSRTRKVVRLR